MFAGSEGGEKAMSIAFTLIETAKLNGVDPQAWLTTRSTISTNVCPGATLLRQRNRKRANRVRAPSPDGHGSFTWPDCQKM